jgi:hypothetical protein
LQEAELADAGPAQLEEGPGQERLLARQVNVLPMASCQLEGRDPAPQVALESTHETPNVLAPSLPAPGIQRQHQASQQEEGYLKGLSQFSVRVQNRREKD